MSYYIVTWPNGSVLDVWKEPHLHEEDFITTQINSGCNEVIRRADGVSVYVKDDDNK